MKKLLKRNEVVNNTVEAFEAKTVCYCQCSCRCSCGQLEHATISNYGQSKDSSHFGRTVFICAYK